MITALASWREHAVNWHVTEAERAAEYPCDRLAEPGWYRLLRGVDVDAPPSVIFRWVCQIKEGPYSYDRIDNFGRTSPRTLTPGAEQLAVGQKFLVVHITDFVTDRHITGTATPQAERLFGPMSMSYVVTPAGVGGPDGSATRSRLVVCLRVGVTSVFRRVVGEALIYGDLIMMRKQLLTLKELAEADALRAGG